MSLAYTARSLLNLHCHSDSKAVITGFIYICSYNDLNPHVNFLSNYTHFKKTIDHSAIYTNDHLRFFTTSISHIRSYSVNMDDSVSKETGDVKASSLSKAPITHGDKQLPMEECIEDCALSKEEGNTVQHNLEGTDTDKDNENLPKGMSKRALKKMERRKKWDEKQRQEKLEAELKSAACGDDNIDKTKSNEGDISVEENENIEIKSKIRTLKEKRQRWRKLKKERKRKESYKQTEELKNLPVQHTNIITREKEGDKVLHHRLREEDGVREYLVRDWSGSSGPCYLTWQPKDQLHELEHLVEEYDKNATNNDVQNDGKDNNDDQDVENNQGFRCEKRKAEEDFLDNQDTKKAKMETNALKAKRPGFSEERFNETSYYFENGLRKVYPYYFTFTTFTANIVHRHEAPVTADKIAIIHMDEGLVVVDKPASIPVHPCGRYRHNTVVFILSKEYNLKNLRTIRHLDRLTSGLLLFGRTPKKTREMKQHIRTRQVTKEYVCRVEGEFPRELNECNEPIEIVSYKIGVCKVASTGKYCRTEFQRLSFNGTTSVVICRPYTGRMHQIRVHLQYLGYPIVNDPLYNDTVFGPNKGKGGIMSKTNDQLIQDLIKIHNAENWLGTDGDAEYSMIKSQTDKELSQHNTPSPKEKSPLADVGPRIVTPTSLTSSDIIPTITTQQETPHTNKASNGCSSSNVAATEGIVSAIGIGGLVGDLDNTAIGTKNSQSKELNYQSSRLTVDQHCYECKVCYRDPKPRECVMYLHALKYSGPGWHFETKLPEWAGEQWKELEDE